MKGWSLLRCMPDAVQTNSSCSFFWHRQASTVVISIDTQLWSKENSFTTVVTYFTLPPIDSFVISDANTSPPGAYCDGSTWLGDARSCA